MMYFDDIHLLFVLLKNLSSPSKLSFPFTFFFKEAIHSSLCAQLLLGMCCPTTLGLGRQYRCTVVTDAQWLQMHSGDLVTVASQRLATKPEKPCKKIIVTRG